MSTRIIFGGQLRTLPFYSLPEPSGDFNVGTVVCDFTDKNCVETFSDQEGKVCDIAGTVGSKEVEFDQRIPADLKRSKMSTF